MMQLGKLKLVGHKDAQHVVTSLKGKLPKIVKEAYIFGSFSRNAAIKGESDMDLFIIPKRKLSLKAAYSLLESEHEALLDIGINLHIVIYDPKRHEQWLLDEARKGIKIV